MTSDCMYVCRNALAGVCDYVCCQGCQMVWKPDEVEDLWPTLDRNHDGVIDEKDAILIFREIMIQCLRGTEEETIKLGGKHTYKEILKMDTNGDGKVTKEELTAFLEAEGDELNYPQPEHYCTDEEWYQLDINRDGCVDKEDAYHIFR